jgi:hypothetical protein
MEKQIENLELRSERVRNIIGQVPPKLVRYGTILVTFIIVLLFLSAYFIPYPETLTIKGHITVTPNQTCVQVLVPYKYINSIQQGMEVIVTIESNVNSKSQLIVSSIDRHIQNINGTHYFLVYIGIENSNLNSTEHLQNGMNASASFLLSDKTIWQYIIRK